MTKQEHLNRIVEKCKELIDFWSKQPQTTFVKQSIAGWRSTIAAIEYFGELCSFNGMNGVAWDGLDSIRAAWPEELL